MSLRQLIMLLTIEQGNFESTKRDERDLLVLEKAKLIRKNLQDEWVTTQKTETKIGAILQLL